MTYKHNLFWTTSSQLSRSTLFKRAGTVRTWNLQCRTVAKVVHTWKYVQFIYSIFECPFINIHIHIGLHTFSTNISSLNIIDDMTIQQISYANHTSPGISASHIFKEHIDLILKRFPAL